MSLKTAICVLIKDENDYLDEWLDHHLNLGIDEIFLYEDYGSKSHLDIVKPYGNRVHLNSIDIMFNSNDRRKNIVNNGGRVQVQLFDYFPKIYKDDFDWILFIDLDEFLILKKPLHDLLKKYSNKPSIFLKWRWYGASGHKNKPIGKVMDNYTNYVSTTFNYWLTFKSFINCKKFKKWGITIHEAIGGVYPLDEYGDHCAWINHYFTKSWEEWKIKILERGDTFPGNRKIMDFFRLNEDMNSIKTDLLLQIAIDSATKLGFNKNKEKGTKYFHFCWFGGGSFNDVNKMCIESWKKYLSDDYIVCLWDENSFDYYENTFCRDAYDNKQYAFVSDYVRLWSVYNFGGVYFDTDVELLKPIDDLPINFMSIEKVTYKINNGNGFGSQKGNEVIGDLLNIYDNLTFDYNGRFGIYCPEIITTYFLDKGYKENKNEIQEFLDFTIYPDKYFAPKNYITKDIDDITEETIAIHHYLGSWS